jgi:regulator of cell morphogenesis and NO signaling
METTHNYYQSLVNTIKTSDDLTPNDFKEYSVRTIIEFLKKSHQEFTEKAIPKIEQLFLILVKNHPNNNQLKTLFNLFLKFEIDLRQHISIEEKTLFPYTETLYRASVANSLQALLLIYFGKHSIKDFANSHENNECYLTEIIYLLEQQKGFKNNTAYNILLRQITQLNDELKIHAWIEDNVLVRKVNAIEQAVSLFVGASKN